MELRKTCNTDYRTVHNKTEALFVVSKDDSREINVERIILDVSTAVLTTLQVFLLCEASSLSVCGRFEGAQCIHLHKD
jgi:hypothetical protein